MKAESSFVLVKIVVFSSKLVFAGFDEVLLVLDYLSPICASLVRVL